jgi:hypothetical protein
MMNKTLANLKHLYYESNEALLAERNRLAEIEDKIKELRQQLRPLHIKVRNKKENEKTLRRRVKKRKNLLTKEILIFIPQAKAMQIDNIETTEPATGAEISRSNLPISLGSSSEIMRSPTPEFALRTARLGGSSLRSHSLTRNPSRLTRVASDAHFLQVFNQGKEKHIFNYDPC